MKILIKIHIIINKITNIVLIFLGGTMVTVVITQTLSRYLFKVPIYWAEELSRYLMIWVCFLGVAVATRNNKHISLNFLVDIIPPIYRNILKITALLLIMCFLSVFIKEGIELLPRQATQLSPALRLRMNWPFLALPVGGILMFFEYLIKLFEQLNYLKKGEDNSN